jgi:chromosome segregation ATPase
VAKGALIMGLLSDRRRGAPRFGNRPDNYDYSKVTTYFLTEEELEQVRNGKTLRTTEEWDKICEQVVHLSKQEGITWQKILEAVNVKSKSEIIRQLEKRKLFVSIRRAGKQNKKEEMLAVTPTETESADPEQKVAAAFMPALTTLSESEGLKQEIESILKQQDLLHEQVEQLEKENKELQERLQHKDEPYNQLVKDYETLKTDNARLEGELHTLKQKYERLEQDYEEMQITHRENAQAFLTLSRRNTIAEEFIQVLLEK